MRHLVARLAGLSMIACGVPYSGAGQEVDFAFLEPTEDAETSNELPLYRLVDDSTRLAELRSWTSNDAADRALSLYEDALAAVADQGPSKAARTLYIALVPRGNNADLGFRLQSGTDIEDHSGTAYVKLGPDDWRFGATLLHETGHVAMTVLAGGRQIARRDMAAIPHSTATLTDRGTAFAEGFAIHFETWLAHTSGDDDLVRRYRHRQFLFGTWPGYLAEHYRQSTDLLNYAQSFSRHQEVRDNAFAFVAAHESDYLRTQLDRTRDFATLRNPNQLLQSEGFYASFFFSLLVRGVSEPEPEVVRARLRRFLTVLADVLPAGAEDPDHPWLLDFVLAHRARYPETADEVLAVLLDLSHGVFVDPNAARMWREHYLAALRLDLEGLGRAQIEAARQRWRDDVERDPSVLLSRIGPQIRCEVPAVTVHLVALGDPAPLVFDANTAQRGVLRLVPSITEELVDRWLAERERTPFSGADDLFARAAPTREVRASTRCEGE